jgi:hypothetical protein
VVHAYGAGNEPYEHWKRFQSRNSAARYTSDLYNQAKNEGSTFLYRSVSRAFGISEEEIRSRTEVSLVGSPLTHERFLFREI